MNNFSDLLSSLPDEIKCTGGHIENKKQVLIRAGKLNVVYENAGLRYISAGNIEIIRRIYPAVRDKSWLTIRQSIEEEHLTTSGKSFRIKIKCKYRSAGIDFRANYLFEGTDESTITMTMEGEALTTFERNRIGFCILHPIEGLAGKKCIIGHPDGSSEEAEFPEEISPHQVFREVKSMKWFTGKGSCSIDLDGDLFETEDQRNWTDASYKTYSTPLSVPFPVTIKKGTRIIQTIKIKFEGEDEGTEAEDSVTTVRLFPHESFRIPSLGIAKSSNPGALKKNETKVLRALRFDHYRIDLRLFDRKWKEMASQGYNEATDLGFEVEFALFFDDNYDQQIKAFLNWLSGRKAQVSSILFFHKSHPTIPDNLQQEVASHIRELFPDIKTGSGTNLNFVNLNRNRTAGSGNDIICFPVQPQEHSSDNLSLVENIEGQRYTVATARLFAPDKEIFVSPVTIQRRFNPHDSFIELPLQDSDVPHNIDTRLMSLFGGCWTAGSMKYLFEAGADSITYFETKGERGIIQGESDSLWPLVFPALKGMIFPVFHVFRFLLANKSFRVIKSRSSKPLITDCLALSDGKQARIILVNFTGAVQSLRFECCSGLFRIRSLNISSFVEAARDFRWTGIENEKITKSQNLFNIEPYSINFIEGWVKH